MNQSALQRFRDDFVGMLRIRLFEEKVRELRLAGDIVGSVHLAIGEEAGPVGVCASLTRDDALFSTYRGHGWAIARGVPLDEMFSELLGRQSGVNGGRGGSAYLTAPQYGFHGENSIVGAAAPIALGAALAGRYDGTNRIAVTVFGDGAMNQGAVSEALNFAAAFSLPVIFVCENNGWSELTPIDDMVGESDLWRRAAAFGMRAERLDGNDTETVRSRMELAALMARAGEGPIFLELTTARLVGHYIGDAETYRRPGELDEALAREPLVRQRARLLESGITEQTIDEIEAQARASVEEAAAIALAAPLATPSDVKDHVYA